MYDVLPRFSEVDSSSEFSSSDSDNVDVVAVDGGGLLGLEEDVDGGQSLARVLLTFFFGGGGIVCVWEVCGGRNAESGLYVSLYSIMLILERVFTREDT